MIPNLKIITLRDVKAENIDWLWKPYLPLGKISIVQGDPGDGKTTLMLAVTAAVTTGATLPNQAGGTPGSVIFQSAEDGLADTIKPRLERLGADCGKVHVIDEEEQALCLSDERIEEAIIQTGAKLFILDPLQGYLGGADMHTANGIRPLMKRLAGVASRTGCAVIIIGHLNKKGGKAQYRGLGSIDIYAAARSVLTVGRVDKDENMRAVVHNKSNLAPAGSSLAFELDPVNGFTWLGDYDISIDELLKSEKQKPESQFIKAQRLIKTMLADGSVPATDMEQMSEDQGISHKTLYRAKSALGVISIRHGGQWYWQMPIDVKYTKIDEQDSHDGQDGQNSSMSALTILPLERKK